MLGGDDDTGLIEHHAVRPPLAGALGCFASIGHLTRWACQISSVSGDFLLLLAWRSAFLAASRSTSACARSRRSCSRSAFWISSAWATAYLKVPDVPGASASWGRR